MMENKTFGRDTFHHIPKNYFPGAYVFEEDASTKSIVVKSDTSEASNLILWVTVRTCVIQYYTDGCGHYGNYNPNTHPYPAYSCSFQTFLSFFDEEEEPGGGGGDGGGDGGGALGGGDNSDPCIVQWYTHNPCTGGWDADDFSSWNPCDYVDTLVKTQFFQQMVHKLRDSCSNQYEIGYSFKKPLALSPQQWYHTGKDDTASLAVDIKWPNFGSSAKRDGIAHNHYLVVSGQKALSIYSAEDIARLWKFLSDGQMADNDKFTFILVTHNTSYILMFSNYADFYSFGNEWLKTPKKVGVFQSLLYDKTDWKDGVHEDSSVTSNAKNFLFNIKSVGYNGAGIKLFKGNMAMNQFIPITVDANGILRGDPCL